jgi:tetratricopeptide (TPR) repeat protein
MSSAVPIVRQVAWLSVLPQLAILFIFVEIARFVGAQDAFLAGAIAYLVILFALRFAVPRHHRRGIRLFKNERFAEAIPHFLLSYEFFSKHGWLDRWRALAMLSSSRISYREMALLNAAFCLGQAGQREQSIEHYRRVVSEFPGSKMAEAALRMLEPKEHAQQAVAADRPKTGSG